MADEPLPPIHLPRGITSRMVDTRPHSLNFHILEAGYSVDRNRPLILLLHGFPEIAYSWRHVMPSLANAGYYVVAPDLRGYGRTTGWDRSDYSHVNLKDDFKVTNLVSDMVVLINALGYHRVTCLVGHDFGAVAASVCALVRPDFFQNLVLMSHPFKGSGSLPFNTANGGDPPEKPVDVEAELAKLDRPRKHYRMYYSTEPANREMTEPREGLHEFLRGYYHLKSADWEGNQPHYLKAWEATELAKMPVYYVMDKNDSMREAVRKEMQHEDPSVVAEKSKRWLNDEALAVYVGEYSRNGFGGGLNWYRVSTDPAYQRDLIMFVGMKIEVPCLFVSGKKDWGTYQEPGVVQKMQEHCTKLRGVELVAGAGHWIQQEQPQVTVDLILGLLSGSR